MLACFGPLLGITPERVSEVPAPAWLGATTCGYHAFVSRKVEAL